MDAENLLKVAELVKAVVEFMQKGVAEEIAEINVRAAKHFAGTGEYENAKTLLVAAYEAAIHPGFLKSKNQRKLYEIALAIAICYKALKQPQASQWQHTTLKHLDKYQREEESLSFLWSPSTSAVPTVIRFQARENIEWAKAQREALPKLLNRVGLLK